MIEDTPKSLLSAGRAALIGTWVQMLLLTIAAMAGSYARVTFGPLQEAIRTTLQLTDNQIAVLQGLALAVPLMVLTIPLGLAIDRYSRIRLILAFSILAMLGNVLTALAHNFVVLMAARCVVGFATLAVNPVAISLVSDLFVPNLRGRATMMIAVGQLAGMSSAFGFGGTLLVAFGSEPDGWRWTILWMTLPLTVVVVLLLAMREPKRTGVTIENPSARQAFAELWRYRAVVLWPLLGIISGEIAVGVVLVWASPTLSRHFSLSADRIGVIMATVLFASGLLGPMLGGTLADVCQRAGGPHRTLIVLVGLAILTVPAALFAKVPTVAAASVLLAAFMTLVNAVCVMGTTLFTIVIPNELRGLCAALLLGSSVLLSIGLAPLTVSLLSSVLGGADTLGSALSIVCIATGVLGATTFLLGRRYSLRAPVPAISSR